jgi:hypothetical protein
MTTKEPGLRVGDEVWVGPEWLGEVGVNKTVWRTVGEDTEGTERMRVPGGWIYRASNIATGQTFAMVFVPDAKKKVVIKRR